MCRNSFVSKILYRATSGRRSWSSAPVVVIGVLMMASVATSVASAEPLPSGVHHWLDHDGAAHYSDQPVVPSSNQTLSYQPLSQSVSDSVTRLYAKANALQKSSVHAAQKRSWDSSPESVKSFNMTPLCQWLQTRTTHLQQLVESNGTPGRSGFLPELQQRQHEWHREQCAQGGLTLHRDPPEQRITRLQKQKNKGNSD